MSPFAYHGVVRALQSLDRHRRDRSASGPLRSLRTRRMSRPRRWPPVVQPHRALAAGTRNRSVFARRRGCGCPRRSSKKSPTVGPSAVRPGGRWALWKRTAGLWRPNSALGRPAAPVRVDWPRSARTGAGGASRAAPRHPSRRGAGPWRRPREEEPHRRRPPQAPRRVDCPAVRPAVDAGFLTRIGRPQLSARQIVRKESHRRAPSVARRGPRRRDLASQEALPHPTEPLRAAVKSRDVVYRHENGRRSR
jgi:hypothetical protein